MTAKEFEWDDAKAAENYTKHGVSFAAATAAFDDPFAIERVDDRENYGEDRFVLIGSVERGVVTIVYTEREDRFRIISARRATKREQDDYFIENN
jgi:uncharacterized DUF497 family protein